MDLDLRTKRYQSDLVATAELFVSFLWNKKILNFAFGTYDSNVKYQPGIGRCGYRTFTRFAFAQWDRIEGQRVQP